MINNNKGSVVLMVILVILVLMISTGVYVARGSTIGLRVIFNEKDYTTSFYALDMVSAWFIDDPDTIINSSTTKYAQNPAQFTLISGDLLPDFQIPNRGHIRDNVKLEISRDIDSLPSITAARNPGNSVHFTGGINFNAQLTDKKSKRQIFVGNQLILPTFE